MWRHNNPTVRAGGLTNLKYRCPLAKTAEMAGSARRRLGPVRARVQGRSFGHCGLPANIVRTPARADSVRLA